MLLITREADYALRIMRALAGGEQRTAADICQQEQIPDQFVYKIAKKLEKAGFLTTYSQEYQGRKRKYYSITPEGKVQMTHLKEEWCNYKDTIDSIIEGRLRN